jgi:hypothetical protein
MSIRERCSLLELVSRARTVLLLGALAVPLAELGHMVGYGFRVSSTGAHWYFPGAVSAAAGLTGGVLIGTLALLVLAKVLSGAVPRRQPWPFALLFTGLLAAQVTVFLIQESLEAQAIPGTATLAIGLLAQQPVALAAALALRWLSARVGPALETIATPPRPRIVLITPFFAPASPEFVVVAVRPARPHRLHGERAPPL